MVKYWTTAQLVAEAAQRGRPLSQRTVQRLCERGALEAIRPGHDWLVPAPAAQQWLDGLADVPEKQKRPAR